MFFALLGAGLIARYVFHQREERVVARDAPVTHTTRRLLRCVLGRGIERGLWPRPEGDDSRPWANTINARLRLMVTREQRDGWPQRCVPVAQRLTARLAGSQFTAAYSAALEAQRLIQDLGASHSSAIATAENGRLGIALATLSIEVIKASVGTEAGWTSAIAHEATDLADVEMPVVPQGQTLPPSIDGATLAAPEWVLFQDVGDRRAHSLLFRERGAPADAVLGPGAPMRVSQANASATLLATDEADSLLPLDTARPLPVPLPLPVRSGEHTVDAWQHSKSANHRWFAYVSRGRAHIYSTPLVGATAWVDRLSPALRDAPIAAIALVPEATAQPTVQSLTNIVDESIRVPTAQSEEVPAAMSAYVLRHGAHGMSVERWHFAAPAEETAAQPASNGAATTTANAAPTTPTTNTVITRELVTRTMIENEGRSLQRPRALVCVSGSTVHFAVASDESYAFYRIANGASRSGDIPVARVGAVSGGRFELSCDERRSLLLVDAMGRPGAMLVYEGDREPQMLPVPLPTLTVQRSVDAAALVPGAVIAFVRTPGSVRVFRSTDASSWQGGAILAQLLPPVAPVPERPDLPSSPGYALTIHAVSTYRERVGVLAVGRGSLVRAVRFFSADGGITWN